MKSLPCLKLQFTNDECDYSTPDFSARHSSRANTRLEESNVTYLICSPEEKYRQSIFMERRF